MFHYQTSNSLSLRHGPLKLQMPFKPEDIKDLSLRTILLDSYMFHFTEAYTVRTGIYILHTRAVATFDVLPSKQYYDGAGCQGERISQGRVEKTVSLGCLK